MSSSVKRKLTENCVNTNQTVLEALNVSTLIVTRDLLQAQSKIRIENTILVTNSYQLTNDEYSLFLNNLY